MKEMRKGTVRLPDGRFFDFEDHNLYAEDCTLLKANLQGFEYDVLYCLASHYPTPLSVDDLIDRIWEKKNPPINPDPSRVRQVISGLRAFLQDDKPFHLIIWVGKSIYSNGGYKCCASVTDHGTAPEKPEAASTETADAGVMVLPENSAEDSVHSRYDNLIKLASLMIHKGDRDHPKRDAELETEIRDIIALLEQGLREDFEEVAEQAWEDLNLIRKAERIFRAYENLTERSRNLNPDGPETRL